MQTAKIEMVNKELEAFSYSVSHDLRSPLRHIDGYVELLADEKSMAGPSDRGRYMKKISESAKQMGLLIDNLLAFSRMGRSAINSLGSSIPTALVEQVREELAPDVKGRKIDWKIGQLPKVYVDKALFKQVWLNLIGNAIKYTRNRETALIPDRLQGAGNRIRIRRAGQWRRIRYALCGQTFWHLPTSPFLMKNSKGPA